MTVLHSFNQVIGSCELVNQLMRLKLQLQIVEARVREVTPNHADLLSDIADETDKIIEQIDESPN